jgi:dephospho-CoA kinase
MKVIGLTGNIGCGKSTVASWLRDMDVAMIDLDAVARQIRNNDAEARRRIEARFGTIEAGKLAAVVFSDRQALADLEAILHPLVRNETRARLAELEAAGVEAACIEAIKLLESPLHDRCDSTWVVRCEEADAVRRVAASRATCQPVTTGGEGGGRRHRDRRLGVDGRDPPAGRGSLRRGDGRRLTPTTPALAGRRH